MRILFARHGESQANLLHQISNRGLVHGLTLRGREQAAALAQRLAPESITHIYTSPLLRAVETAVLVAERLQVEYEVVDALREYDCGEIEGRSDAAAWQRWQELFDAWMERGEYDYRLAGGESFNDICARFLPFIEGLVRDYGAADARLLCISHGGLYLTMLPLVLRDLGWRELKERGFGNAAYLAATLSVGGLYCVE